MAFLHPLQICPFSPTPKNPIDTISWKAHNSSAVLIRNNNRPPQTTRRPSPSLTSAETVASYSSPWAICCVHVVRTQPSRRSESWKKEWVGIVGESQSRLTEAPADLYLRFI